MELHFLIYREFQSHYRSQKHFISIVLSTEQNLKKSDSELWQALRKSVEGIILFEQHCIPGSRFIAPELKAHSKLSVSFILYRLLQTLDVNIANTLYTTATPCS